MFSPCTDPTGSCIYGRKPAAGEWEGGGSGWGAPCTTSLLPPLHHDGSGYIVWFLTQFPIPSGAKIFPWILACLDEPQSSIPRSGSYFLCQSCWPMPSCERTCHLAWPWRVTLSICQNYRFLVPDPNLFESETLGEGRFSRWGNWGSERWNYRLKSTHAKVEPQVNPDLFSHLFLCYSETCERVLLQPHPLSSITASLLHFLESYPFSVSSKTVISCHRSQHSQQTEGYREWLKQAVTVQHACKEGTLKKTWVLSCPSY